MENKTDDKILRAFIPTITRMEGEESRKYTFEISNESVDRHGTIIKASAWDLDNYNRNGIVAYQHQTGSGWFEEPNADNIIGKGQAYLEDNKLIGLVELETEDINPLAEKIKKKIDFGTLKATSVGFIPKRGHQGNPEEGEDESIYYFDEVELIEFSIVNIPSNPLALKRSMNEQFKNYLQEQKPSVKVSQTSQMNRNTLEYLKIKSGG